MVISSKRRDIFCDGLVNQFSGYWNTWETGRERLFSLLSQAVLRTLEYLGYTENRLLTILGKEKRKARQLNVSAVDLRS